jgi:FlaA1/EpsC-like NDP-sugar epimerase
VRVFSRDDTKQALLAEQHRDHRNVRYLIGDIRDRNRLLRAMEDVDIVFHTAALKHVLAAEYNPFEAVQTNVIGTQNVIDCALAVEPDKVIFTSSDKAVNPSNAMGTSKLMAERLMTAANYYKGKRRTVFSSVRFGNVVGSRGSVVRIFRDQIRSGGPVTLTSRDMTRFVMAPAEAIRLVFEACWLARSGEVFVLKMPVMRIADLAEVMVEDSGSRGIRLEEIGLKAGEKLAEELLTEEERSRTLELERLLVILPAVREFRTDWDFGYPEARPFAATSYRSDELPPLSKDEIRTILKESGDEPDE